MASLPAKFSATPGEFEKAQLDFDFLIPFGPLKKTMTTPEVAFTLGISTESVRQLVETGQLESIQFNASNADDDAKKYNCITRRSVTVLAMRKANFNPADLTGTVAALVNLHFTETQRAALRAQIK